MYLDRQDMIFFMKYPIVNELKILGKEARSFLVECYEKKENRQ